MKSRSIAILALMMLICSISFVNPQALTEVPSGQLNVQYDDGTGALFKTLPENYAKLNNLSLSKAVIVSGSGYSIVNGQSGSSSKYTRPHLIWTGKLSYGGNTRTKKEDATLKKNSLPAVTFKVPDGAELSDGKTADVIVTLDNIAVNVSKSYNSKITSSTNVKVVVAASDSKGLWLVAASPKTALDKWDYTNNDKSTSAGAAYRVRTTIKLTEPAAGKTIGSAISQTEYPSMLIEFRDLDVRDFTLKKNSTYTQLWNGTYSEGIEMTTGWGNPIALAPKGKDILNQSFLEKQTVNGNTKIKGKGSQYEAFETVTGSANDSESFYSGFAAPVSPSGFSFYWTGSVVGGEETYANMGTVISGQPTVAVRAKRTEGGSLGNDETGVSSGLNSWKNNTHLMNSAATYCYAPEEGWTVQYLKVDGEDIDLTEEERLNGGEYVFERLNKNPVVKREWKDGKILDAEDSSYYTIEVAYIRNPDYTTVKTSDVSKIKSMSNDEITYTINCKEKYTEASSGSHQIKDDLGNGLLRIVPDSVKISVTEGSSYTIDKQDADGLWVTFHSAGASSEKSVPEINITYKATVDWTKYSGGKIINTADDTNEIEVVNNIVIAKKVKGNLRDTTKQFEFLAELHNLKPETEYEAVLTDGGAVKSVQRGTSTEKGFMTDSEGNAVLELGMKADELVTVLDLPMSAQYVVREKSSDHIASYEQSSDQETPVFVKKSDANTSAGKDLATELETLDADDGQISIVFTNCRDSVPVTGGLIPTDYFLPGLLVVTAGAIASVFIRRRISKR